MIHSLSNGYAVPVVHTTQIMMTYVQEQQKSKLREIKENSIPIPLYSGRKFTAGANRKALQRGVNSLLKNTFGWLQKVY